MPQLPHVRFYLDTAEVTAWESWMPTGLFYGVTSNPLLLERAKVACTLSSLTHLAHKAFALGAQEVQLQTWGDTIAALVSTGEQLAALDARVVVKVPITRLGTTAAAQLAKLGVRVTLTAVYSVPQVLIAAALGAEYVAPYLGRINDLGQDGRALLAEMQRALNGVQSPTRILAASIRDLEDISYLATQGLDTFTFAPKIASAFFDIKATIAATEDFERAAKAMGASTAHPAQRPHPAPANSPSNLNS
ncbi:MAG: transaldolase family protein [Cyanobacteria bacterium J06635_1]